MKAVAVNHGSTAAFSTGSQPQNPPHPSSSYAQIMPSVRPNERKIHANIVQRRTARSHASSRCPVMSAAMANANGIVIPTKPMYSDGGWMTLEKFYSSGFSPLPAGGTCVKYVLNGLL